MHEVKNIVIQVFVIIHYIWHYGLIVIGSNHITFGNILSALFMLFIGLKYKDKLFTYVNQYIKTRISEENEHNVQIFQNIFSCFIYAAYAFLLFEIANIPTSSITFLGGALALGIGLGAQNLINNVISGLIIMIEKPIKVGDRVEILYPKTIRGNVVSIGIRCTRIRIPNSTDLILPNSKILQDPLINLTYNDSNIDVTTLVSFAINSEHESCMEVLDAAAQSIVKHIPQIKIVSINSKSIDFEVNFKIDTQKDSASLVQDTFYRTLLRVSKEKNLCNLIFKASID